MKKFPFNKVVTDVTSKFHKIKKSDYLTEGLYPIIDQGRMHIAGYTNDKQLVNKKYNPIIIFGDHTRVFKFERKSIALGADGAKALWVNQEIAFDYYVFLFLKSIQLKNAGYSRHFKFLKEYKIPLPPINDQIRIATLLSRIEALIATRKANLKLLDDFLKSTFLEMFGDPVSNEKKWKVEKLGDVLSDIESGWSPKCEARPVVDNEWGVLKLGAVTYCNYDDSQNKALPENLTPKPEKEVHNGDLLFTRKNTYELVAASAYVFSTKPKLMMPDLIFRLVIKDKTELNPIYLWKLLVNTRQRKSIQRLAGGAAGSMPNISKAKLRTANIILPPPELQTKFSSIVEKVEEIKSLYQQNLNELENLYGSVSQKAFKGELDLSHIPLPKDEQEPEKKPEESSTNTTPVYAKETPDNKAETEPVFFKTDKKEEQLFCSIFNKYLNSHKGKTFTFDDYFFYWAQYEDVDDNVFGLADYELTKKWVYQLIKNGSIQQDFDVEKHELVLKLNG